MKIGTIVKNTKTGFVGVVVSDIMSCCTEDETPVVYDGDDGFVGTETSRLVEVDTYNSRVAEPNKCGAGEGAACCKYLAHDRGGWECLRFGEFRNTILFKSDMVAQGSPTGLFPKCQDEIQQGISAQRETDNQ